jgi:hypothetical protein
MSMSKAVPEEDFFIGDAPEAAGTPRRFTFEIFVLAGLLALTVAALAAHGLSARGEGNWTTQPIEVEGTLVAREIPYINFRTPTANGNASVSFLLTGPGKFGFPEELRTHDGKRVRVRGRVAHRGSIAALELAHPADLTVIRDATEDERPAPPRPITQEGLHLEVVSAKCFLGWHQPGFGKVHRNCAKACLDNEGIGMIIVHGRDGGVSAAVLRRPGIRGAGADFSYRTGRPMHIAGGLVMLDDIPIFVPDMDSLQVLYYQSLFL